jgi:hypothetical protein
MKAHFKLGFGCYNQNHNEFLLPVNILIYSFQFLFRTPSNFFSHHCFCMFFINSDLPYTVKSKADDNVYYSNVFLE